MTAIEKPSRTYIPLEYTFTGTSTKSSMPAEKSMIVSIAASICLRDSPRIAPLR